MQRTVLHRTAKEHMPVGCYGMYDVIEYILSGRPEDNTLKAVRLPAVISKKRSSLQMPAFI